MYAAGVLMNCNAEVMWNVKLSENEKKLVSECDAMLWRDEARDRVSFYVNYIFTLREILWMTGDV